MKTTIKRSAAGAERKAIFVAKDILGGALSSAIAFLAIAMLDPRIHPIAAIMVAYGVASSPAQYLIAAAYLSCILLVFRLVFIGDH